MRSVEWSQLEMVTSDTCTSPDHLGQRIYVQVACLTNRRLRTVVSLFRWSDPTMESVAVSNRDCVVFSLPKIKVVSF